MIPPKMVGKQFSIVEKSENALLKELQFATHR
jgi:hypothetical protein